MFDSLKTSEASLQESNMLGRGKSIHKNMEVWFVGKIIEVKCGNVQQAIYDDRRVDTISLISARISRMVERNIYRNNMEQPLKKENRQIQGFKSTVCFFQKNQSFKEMLSYSFLLIPIIHWYLHRLYVPLWIQSTDHAPTIHRSRHHRRKHPCIDPILHTPIH